jgi:hypothetical protein
VRPDPFDALTAYVTVSGFRWNEPLPRIYKTTNRGAAWTPISSNLPDAPVNDVIVDPEVAGRLFAATDVGMFESVDDGGTWSPLGTDLPNVVVTDLAYDADARRLVAATYGRSFFSLAVPEVTGVGETGLETASLLLPPAPNPAQDGTWLSWRSEGVETLSLEIYAASGRRVRTFEGVPASTQRLFWDGRDSAGRKVAAGAYFARAESERGSLGTRTVLITR